MSSIIPGFEYDIFISYRQKDNKGDKWVSEFVEALKTELESTFKEEISIYFDLNPHYGLLETHDVAETLKEKLKCLVFIPIISRTYCDPKSFAWEYEFKAFIELVSQDQFGLKVKLPNGNIASRVLPIRIHDLDNEDIKLCESVLGGVIRGIEFIYREPGVNKPLFSDDDEKKNLNNTKYRIQINKTANSIKEIIMGLKVAFPSLVKGNAEHAKNINFGFTGRDDAQDEQYEKKDPDHPVKSTGKNKRKILISGFILGIAIIALLVINIIGGGNINTADDREALIKTIAVMPFRDLSNDSTQGYFCDGFMEEILINLQKVNEYTVRSRTSTDQYRKTTKTPETIGKEINVNYIIEGSVGKDDNNIKIWVKLINIKTNKSIWSNDYTRELGQIFSLQSEIAKEIAVELKTVLSPEEIKQIDKKPTENLEAYNYYLLGNDYYRRSFEKQNFEIAAKMYGNAIESDPDFALAYVRLSLCYLQLHWFHYEKGIDRLAKSKEAIDAAFKIDPDLPDAHLALGNYYYMGLLDYAKALEHVYIAEERLKNNPECIYLEANIYRRAGQWTLAKGSYLKAFEFDPGSAVVTHNLGVTFSLLGEYQEAEKYFQKTTLLNPTFIEAIWQKSFMYIKWKGNTIQARATISEAFQFAECISNPLLFESNVLNEIYDGNYQKAISYLSSKDIDLMYVQFYVNLKSLLYARVYALMNKPGKAYEYFDSARVTLDSLILLNPDDSRLYSALGIAYAGMGLKEKAIEAGKRGVKLMPIDKEAYRGVFRAEDLARIYVMVGEYDLALEQIKILLSIPSRLSVNLLLLDPIWKPLWDLSEFKKITKLARS